MKLEIIFLAFLCVASIESYADSPAESKSTAPAVSTQLTQIQEEALSKLSVKSSVALDFGSTSNATLLNSPTAGNYSKLDPSLLLEYTASDSVFISSGIEGALKRFSDPNVASIANENSLRANGDFAWTLSDSLEVGSNLSFNYLDNHIPVVGANTVEAIPQTYTQPEERLYGAWTGEVWALEFGGSATSRKYTTTTFDIQGNIYKNSYDEFKIDGKVGYRWSKDLRLTFKSTLEHRNYQEHMAEFTDGLPAFPGSPNPILVTTAEENEIQLKNPISKASLIQSVGIRLEKDQVFGARDSIRFKIREKIVVSLNKKLSFEPEVSVSRRGYSNFRSDPLNDPQNSSLRVDWEERAMAPFKYSLSKKASLVAQYAFNRKDSNYNLENYLEHVIEGGVNFLF